MIVAILIVVWVVVLRVLYQKKEMEDRQKAGLVSPGPAGFDTLKRKLEEISEQLGDIENDYQQLARRTGGRRE
jgi:predicted transcriptional regulator